MMLDRKQQFDSIGSTPTWDMIIIGGGATGLGIAVDAASRGYKTLLLERDDFAKGTSSRSTKLVHGGVRYLANGDIKLVIGALKERWYIFKNARHVARTQSFIIPCYSFIDKWKYLIGLKLYDWLAGRFSIGRSTFLNKTSVANALGNIKTDGLRGGIKYFDGQFDDARLAINLAQTAVEQGASVINYARVTGLEKDNDGHVSGVRFVDRESDTAYTVSGKAVVNATGIFVDDILSMEDPAHKKLVRPSQGTHIVVDMSFLPASADALMIPKTSDGRVLFGVPWHGRLVLGTTDTPLEQKSAEPRPLEDEISFILDTAQEYMHKAPTRKDVLSTFAGLRPLAANEDNSQKTKEISRDHKLIVSESGLITITGGKWTTYRKMAEETVNKAIKTAKLNESACITKTLTVHGSSDTIRDKGRLRIYGTDADEIERLIKSDTYMAQKIHTNLPYTYAEIVWAVRNEMARTIEDVLSRRLRVLLLDARAAIECAQVVGKIMATELGFDNAWVLRQIQEFELLAEGYLIKENNTISIKY